jgi:hypothetical protein
LGNLANRRNRGRDKHRRQKRILREGVKENAYGRDGRLFLCGLFRDWFGRGKLVLTQAGHDPLFLVPESYQQVAKQQAFNLV